MRSLGVDVLVVGGGAAGMSAASWARRRGPSLRIAVLEATNIISHAPCGIPYYVGGLFSDYSLFQAYDVRFFREKRNIEVITGARAVEADLRSRQITAEANGERVKVEYDRLVIATGARPRRLQGISGPRVLYAHHPAEARELREALAGASSVIVVGGGVLGVEMAEQLARLGKRVTLVHRGSYLMSRDLDPPLGQRLVEELRFMGVTVLLNRSVVSSSDEGSRLLLDDGEEVRADYTLVAAGVEPNLGPLEGQVPTGPHGAIAVDDFMRAGKDEVFAAGDVAEHRNLVTGLPDWRPLAPIANKMGLVAGVNAAGGSLRFPGVAGDLITRVGETIYGRVGLNEAEARRTGIRYLVGEITTRSRARYYPGGGQVYFRVLAEEGSGRVIGAQAAGPEEIIGRLGVVAVALLKHMSIEDLFFAELGYHPSAGRAWDPLVLAARQLLRV